MAGKHKGKRSLTTYVDIKNVEYLDIKIKEGVFRSYGHAVDALIMDYRRRKDHKKRGLL